MREETRRQRLWIEVVAGLALAALAAKYSDRPTPVDWRTFLAAVRPYRLMEARLSGGFHHQVCPSSAGSEMDVPTAFCPPVPSKTRGLAAKLSSTFWDLAAHPSPDQLHRAALALLVASDRRKLPELIAVLEDARELGPLDPAIANDLAALHLEVAAQQNRPRSLLAALELLEPALGNHPTPELAFNRALVFEKLRFPHQTVDAWERFLKVEKTGPWADEARRHLDRVQAKLGELSPSEQVREALSKDSADLRRVVQSYTEAARDVAFFEVLGDWGLAYLNGRKDASILLAKAHTIGEALATSGGDRSLLDAVLAIESASSPHLRKRLAAGHRDMADAATLLEAGSGDLVQPLIEPAVRALQGTGSPAAAWAETIRGWALLNMHRLTEAAAAFEKLVRSRCAAIYPGPRGYSYAGLGHALFQQGHFDKSLIAFGTAAGALEEVGNRVGLASVLGMIASNHRASGDLDSAWRVRYRSLALLAAEPAVESGASVLWGALRDAAEEGFTHSLQLIVREIEPRESANSAVERAAKLIARRSELSRQLEEPTGDLRRMLDWQRAAKGLKTVPVDRSRLIVRDTKQHKSTDALAELVAQVTARLASLSHRPEKASSDSQAILVKQGAFGIEQEKDQGYPLRGVSTRQLELEWQLALRRMGIGRTADQSSRRELVLFQAEALLRRAIDALYQGEIAQAEGSLLAALDLFEANRRELRRLRNRRDYSATWRPVFDVFLGLAVAQGRPALARRIFEVGLGTPLDSSEPSLKAVPLGLSVLELAAHPSFLAVWNLDSKGWQAHNQPVAASERQPLVEHFIRVVASSTSGWEEVRDAGKPLSALLFTWRLPSHGRLCIVTEGELAGLPFAALPHPATGRPLVESLVVTFSDSAAACIAAAEGEDDVVHPARAGAQVVIQPSSELTYSKLEAAELLTHFPGTTALIGPNATRTAVIDQLPRARRFHYAGHVIANARRPELSFLPLAGEGEQSTVTAEEIEGLSLPGLDLAVLAGCKTFTHRPDRPESLSGLGRAFLDAGATTVVGTLWDVDDAATRTLMQHFYRELRNQRDPTEALAIAQRRMLASSDPRLASPAAWAGFAVVEARGGRSKQTRPGGEN